MESPKNLRRPSNWQDFEKLCRVLWGEIWECPEIQKNGTQGQEQYGVDIYGIPLNENAYYGIQCKGKSEYTHSQFTKKEIGIEIKKAKTFDPKLKKLYFATTATNDSKIQTYFRQLNIDHISKGLFEVHYFSWETIVDLIDENPRTYNFYVKSQNYKLKKSVTVTFENGENEIECFPKFRQKNIDYKQKIVPAFDLSLINPKLADLLNATNKYSHIYATLVTETAKLNLSYFSFELFIHNTGDEPIEDYKIFLEFEGGIQDLKDNNVVNDKTFYILERINYQPNTYLWVETLTGKIVPKNRILVGDDTIKSEIIFIKPFPKESEIKVNWKLISRDLKEDGTLTILVKPNTIVEYEELLVEDPLKVRFEKGEIEDYLIEKKEKNH